MAVTATILLFLFLFHLVFLLLVSVPSCYCQLAITVATEYKYVDGQRAHLQKSILSYLCGESAQSSGGGTVSLCLRHVAPEIQSGGWLSAPTRAGDVYSFGIIVRDLFLGAAGDDRQQADGMPVKARQIMELACHENTVKRPAFDQLEKSMRSTISGAHANLLDRCSFFSRRSNQYCMLGAVAPTPVAPTPWGTGARASPTFTNGLARGHRE